MNPAGCQEAFDRYRAGLDGPDAVLDCLRHEGTRWLAAHATGLHHQDLEDLLQDALEVTLRSLPRFRGSAYLQLRKYFLAVLNSRLSNHFRQARGKFIGLPPLPGQTEEESTESATDVADVTAPSGFEDEVTLQLDLRELLSPEEYRVVRLKLEGCTDRETGEMLGKAPGTVAALYHRARQKLRPYVARGP
ncbi:MAG: sigma-70 family RNA polymerase sigma factor [Armatimonadota bacterium]|nr:sigma-70 family RNA polymerase sigma factor [Armatimonadota bacterium]